MIWEIENAFQISLRCDLLGKKEERKRVDAHVCGNCSSAACGGLEPEVVRHCRLAAEVSSAGPGPWLPFPPPRLPSPAREADSIEDSHGLHKDWMVGVRILFVQQ